MPVTDPEGFPPDESRVPTSYRGLRLLEAGILTHWTRPQPSLPGHQDQAEPRSGHSRPVVLLWLLPPGPTAPAVVAPGWGGAGAVVGQGIRDATFPTPTAALSEGRGRDVPAVPQEGPHAAWVRGPWPGRDHR